MFRNCRACDKDDSSIYKDAIVLEKMLIDYFKDLGWVAEDSLDSSLVAKNSPNLDPSINYDT